jgi:hypothetical protein
MNKTPKPKNSVPYRIIPPLLGERLQAGRYMKQNPQARKSVPYRITPPLFGKRLQDLSEGGQVQEYNPPSQKKCVPYRIISTLIGECLQSGGYMNKTPSQKICTVPDHLATVWQAPPGSE